MSTEEDDLIDNFMEGKAIENPDELDKILGLYAHRWALGLEEYIDNPDGAKSDELQRRAHAEAKAQIKALVLDLVTEVEKSHDYEDDAEDVYYAMGELREKLEAL